MLRKSVTLLLSLLITLTGLAQEAPVEMADSMRANGKIYVVVAVLATVFVGIVVYLVMLDRKVTRLEKQG